MNPALKLWWRQTRPVLAGEAREKLLIASVLLGVAAVTANRLGRKIGEWGTR